MISRFRRVPILLEPRDAPDPELYAADWRRSLKESFLLVDLSQVSAILPAGVDGLTRFQVGNTEYATPLTASQLNYMIDQYDQYHVFRFITKN